MHESPNRRRVCTFDDLTYKSNIYLRPEAKFYRFEAIALPTLSRNDVTDNT